MAKREKSRTEIMTACTRRAKLLLVLMIVWDIGCIALAPSLDKSNAYIGAHGARILVLLLVRWGFSAAESIIRLLCDIAEQRQAASPAQGSAAAAPGSAAPAAQSAPGSAAPAAQSAPESVPGTYNAQREADIYRMSQRATRTGAEAVRGFIDGDK